MIDMARIGVGESGSLKSVTHHSEEYSAVYDRRVKYSTGE